MHNVTGFPFGPLNRAKGKNSGHHVQRESIDLSDGCFSLTSQLNLIETAILL